MKNLKILWALALPIMVSCTFSYGQAAAPAEPHVLKTYLIEREIPGAGQFTAQQLQEISQKSCSVLQEMGPEIQWLQSYVTEDKIYCIYRAESKEAILEHASKGGFPANKISELSTQISPETATLKLQ